MESLPAFLTAPLACSPSNCSSPNTPLPPVPAGLSDALATRFAQELRYSLWELVGSEQVANWVGISRISVVALARRARDLPTLTQYLRVDESDSTWSATLEIVKYMVLSEDSMAERRQLTVKVSTAFGLALQRMAKMLQTSASRENGSLCLHDILSRTDEWSRPPTVATVLRSLVEHEDPQQLLDLVAEDIADGILCGSGWEEPAAWRPVVMGIQARFMAHTLECVSKVAEEIAATDGYNRVAQCDDFVLRLLCCSALMEPTNLRVDGGEASDTKQLMQFCFPVDTASTPLASDSSSSAPDSTELTTSTFHTFDRFRPIPTTSHYFPLYPRYPTPRCCPPNRCSGAGALDNLELVEQALRLLWAASVSSILSVRYVENIGELRYDLVRSLAENVSTFDVPEKRDLERIIQLGVNSSAVWLPGGGDYGLVLSEQLSRLKETLTILCRARGDPRCLCDFFRVSDVLDLNGGPMLSAGAGFVKARLQTISVSQDSAVANEIAERLEREIRGGKIKGRSWKNCSSAQLEKWVRSVEREVNVAIVGSHFQSRCEAWNDLPVLLGWTRVLEESLWKEETDQSYVGAALLAMASRFDGAAADPFESSPRKNAAWWKSTGDDNARSGALRAIDSYDYATLWNPVNSDARLNSAAVRLLLANNSDQSFQWSRAINDCTLALYYGPPSFKAYYRRGFALAHLKLWDKAILDYQQALLLEPHNALVKLLLRNARAKRPS